MEQTARRAPANTLLAVVLAGFAALAVAGYALDLVRLPINPPVLAVVALGAALTAYWRLHEPRIESGLAVAADLIAVVLIVGGVFAYVLWLAWPSLLPIADGPDLVHHLSLIHFIQRTHHLPRDPALTPYLGEMMTYTPGGHIIAAMAGEWFRIDALRLVHPLLALFVALKTAIVYAIARQVLPADARTPLHAAAAALLLVVPIEYFLGASVKYGFFAQVIAETFAAGTLLALVWWVERPDRARLVLCGLCGAASFLAWPVFLPAVVAALLIALALRRASFTERAIDVVVACLPIGAVVAVHTLSHMRGAGLLKTGGFVTVPSLAVFGWGFLALGAIGAVLGFREPRARVVLLFAACVLGEMAALAALDAYSGSTMFYLPYKMVYLVIPAGAVLGAFALAQVSAVAVRRWRAIAPLALCFPIVVAASLLKGRVPLRPLRSPISEAVYEAGRWTHDNLPAACVDYFSQHWLTGYWLHVDVLGNARVSPRTRAESFEFRDTVAKWIEHRGLAYAIVEDLSAVPHEVREEMALLRQFGAAAVVRARRPVGCDDGSVSIEHVR